MKDMGFKILSADLLDDFKAAVRLDPSALLQQKTEEALPVDYFQFYHAVSSVYSSKIEGEDVDYDSYFKHKFLKVAYQPDYTKKADDLFQAYEFIMDSAINGSNILKAHDKLSKHLLPASQRGRLRNNPMFVINENDRIEYVAADPAKLKEEWTKLLADIEMINNMELDVFESFYFAAMIHLVFVKIHPFQDGNGRMARLLEKWVLLSKIGKKAAAVELEKNYYRNRTAYYENIRRLGLEYAQLDYTKSLNFLLMTIQGVHPPEIMS